MNNLPVIRHQQIKNIISPLYENAGLIIQPLFWNDTQGISWERYKLLNKNNQGYIVCVYLCEYPLIEKDLITLDKYLIITIVRDNWIHLGNIGIIHRIKVRTETHIGYSKKNKQLFHRIYIHQDDRVEALKQALVHIVLMGDY